MSDQNTTLGAPTTDLDSLFGGGGWYTGDVTLTSHPLGEMGSPTFVRSGGYLIMNRVSGIYRSFSAGESPRVPPVPEESRQSAIVGALFVAGRTSVVNRLLELFKLVDQDPDEPRIVTASLRNLAQFLSANPQLKSPGVGLDPEGYLAAEWAINGGGLVATVFLPDDHVRYADLPGDEVEREAVSGTCRRQDALEHIPSLSTLTS